MKKTYKSILILVTLIIILVLYLFNTDIIVHEILEYSKLFLTKLFPVSFLFFIMSSLLIDFGLIQFMNYYLHVNTSGLYVFLISMISGFPSGSKYTKELYQKKYISASLANRFIMFSHFPNPLFVMNSVYLVVHDKKICFQILFAIVFSNLCIFLFSTKKKNNSKFQIDNRESDDFSLILTKAINASFHTIIIIYGTSLFFYLLSNIITRYLSLGTYAYVFICGLFDLTKGVFSTTLIRNTSIRVLFLLFFISFGGISIHMQTKSILADTPIKYKYFFFGRILGTILTFVFYFLFSMLF